MRWAKGPTSHTHRSFFSGPSRLHSTSYLQMTPLNISPAAPRLTLHFHLQPQKLPQNRLLSKQSLRNEWIIKPFLYRLLLFENIELLPFPFYFHPSRSSRYEEGKKVLGITCLLASRLTPPPPLQHQNHPTIASPFQPTKNVISHSRSPLPRTPFINKSIISWCKVSECDKAEEKEKRKCGSTFP